MHKHTSPEPSRTGRKGEWQQISQLLINSISLIQVHTIYNVQLHSQYDLDEVGLTAKNSTSLHRCPVPPNLSVKGEPTNYPFWPGWLLEICSVSYVCYYFTRWIWEPTYQWEGWFQRWHQSLWYEWTQPVPHSICLYFFFIGLDDLLTLAPGMSSGMSFSSEEKAEAVTTNVDLSELIFGEGAVIKWPDPIHSQPDDQVV